MTVVRSTAIASAALVAVFVLGVLSALAGVVLGRVSTAPDPTPVVVSVQAAPSVVPATPKVVSEEEDGAGVLSDGRGFCLRGGLCNDQGPIPADWIDYLQAQWQVYAGTDTTVRFDQWLATQAR